MDGHTIMFHTCTGCGGCYGTMFKSGPHECPTCGHVDHLRLIHGPGLVAETALMPRRAGPWR